MGLRKFLQNNVASYIFAEKSSTDELRLIILQENEAFLTKLTVTTDTVLKWCQKVDKTPEEYLDLICSAVDRFSLACVKDSAEESNENIFQIEDGFLQWKQYFTDKKLYGRRGKFKLEKLSLMDAIKELLDGALGELDSNAKRVHELKQESEKQSRELKNALTVAEKSVKAKEDFEQEVYSKCAALINAKKLRIRQLVASQAASLRHQSNNSSSLPGTSSGPIRTIEASKRPRGDDSGSDVYESDTDVDEPEEGDMDTDEENLARISPRKQGKDQPVTLAESKLKKTKHVIDSQDLFDNSLEAELYPKANKNQQNISGKATESGGYKRGKKREMNSSFLAGTEGSLNSSSSSGSKSVKLDESPPSIEKTGNSILEELF